jgi:hypothetical protein
MNNDSALRPSGLIGGPVLELVDEAALTTGFAAAARLKSAGWLHATPMALWDEQHDRITIPVVIGSMPMPTLGRGFFVSIRSWNWNTDKPRFDCAEP